MHACSNQISFFTFPTSKELYIFLSSGFLSYAKHYLSTKKLPASNDAYLGWDWSKIWFFVQKSWFFCNSKHFRQNVMRPWYSCFFCIFYISNFFQTIMVSLFLAGHDQYLIMFKDSNVFKFTNFHWKQSIIIPKFILLIAIIYSLGKNKKNNCWNNSLIKSTLYF